MTSIHWVRTVIAGALLAQPIQQAVAQASAECDVIVNGQNDSAVDVAAVTAAVNAPPVAGDVTVCLAGTFDFGLVVPANNVSVAIAPPVSVTSLRVVGLDDAATGRKATIRHGVQSLSLAGIATLPHLAIENLRFVDPAFSAISILRANESVRIAGIHVTGVRTFVLPAFNLRFRTGVSVTSALAPIGGSIVIADSVLNGGTYGPDDGALALSAGISLVGAAPTGSNQPFTARVQVSDNRLVNWSGTGILATGLSEASIERNTIQPGAFANLVAGCAAPNGVGAANGISLASVSDSVLRDNAIALVPALTLTGTPPACTAGVMVAGALAGPADGNVFHRNRIRGAGTYAIMVGTAGGSIETDNIFALDRLGNFAPLAATVFLGPGATDNVLVGNFPTIEGNVAGNIVLGR